MVTNIVFIMHYLISAEFLAFFREVYNEGYTCLEDMT